MADYSHQPQVSGTTAPTGFSEMPQTQHQAVAPAYGEDKAQFAYSQQQPQPENQQQYPQAGVQQPQAPVMNTFNYATPLATLQQGPAPVDCPVCGVREMTRTEAVSGGTTHLAALLFCCVACLGCIPYLASWFKDIEHKCGKCGALLAVWHRSGRTEVVAHGATQVQGGNVPQGQAQAQGQGQMH